MKNRYFLIGYNSIIGERSMSRSTYDSIQGVAALRSTGFWSLKDLRENLTTNFPNPFKKDLVIKDLAINWFQEVAEDDYNYFVKNIDE